MAYSKYYNQTGIGLPVEDPVKKAYISSMTPKTSTGEEPTNITQSQMQPVSTSPIEQTSTQQSQALETPSSEQVAASAGAVTQSAQGANRDSYLAALDQLVQNNGATINDQLKYQIQMYEEQLKAQKAALDAEKAENEAALNAEAERIAAEGIENRRQTEADAAKARANWNETANAYGLNSGTQGQASLSFANQLQSDLNALRNAEAQARAEVERQRLTLGQKYQAAIEQAQAENNQQLVQLLYEQALKADNSASSGGGYGGSFYGSTKKKKPTASDKINDLASKITGDPFTDSNLLSAEDQDMINKEMMARGGSLEEMTEFLYNRVYPTLVNRAGSTRANGDAIKNLVNTIEGTTGRTDFERFYEWEPESSKSSAKTASSSNPTSSASTPQFGSGANNEYGLSMGTLKSTVGQQLKSGNYSAAEKMMDQYAGSLTKSQWNELANVYNKYGYELDKY